jgi:hypothetical protein
VILSRNGPSEFSLLLPLWHSVATFMMKSSAPIATVIGPAWQWLNIVMGVVTASARCYYDICVKIWCVSLLLPLTKRDCQWNLLHRIFLPPATACQWAHMYQRTRVASKRRTGWSSKLLDIFDQVILLWDYKMVDMKYSRWVGTKDWVWLKWSAVATGVVSELPVATVTLCSNGLVPSARPLLLWSSPLASDWT